MEIKLDEVTHTCFKKISISFKDGLINGVLGSNGSGKTILADILSTYVKPIDGNLEIDGVIIDNDNPMINYEMMRFDIGYVRQDLKKSFFYDTVEEQLTYILTQYNYKNNKKQMVDALKMVGLDNNYLNRKIDTLSSLELFKISLSCSLIINPKILILDDPTTFLDYQSKKNLIKLLRMLKNRYHKTIIILSSNSDFILELCDYVYILGNHKLICEGTKFEVFSKKLDKYGIAKPNIIAFEDLVTASKKIKIGYRDTINDLIKDIYFYKN